MTASVTAISAGGAREQHRLASLLDAEGLEQVATESYRWIKQLRVVPYGADGSSHSVPMRERFRYRDDSLWWFTELYLHKTRRMESAVRTILALEALCGGRAPARVELGAATPVEQAAAVAFGRHHGLPVTCHAPRPVTSGSWWPSYSIGLTARLSRLRPVHSQPEPHTRVAAFVHAAFVRASGDGSPGDRGGGESYIGPVIAEVGRRVGERNVTCVGLGPRRNFRARRWWDPLVGGGRSGQAVVAVERLAPPASIIPALSLWRQRHQLARDVVSGPGVRDAARVRGCDLWDVLRAELIDAARLQWPWSARAMDEAGAALDALAPQVAVTYAEAGGWGRALVLEARRRGIPSVGIQHGFIYRHWLNYLHEPDELQPLGPDGGFPCPDRTLVFDAFAARHLAGPGHLPADSLRITGSTARDRLVDACVQLGRGGSRETIRRELGVGPDDHLLVLAAKFSEIRGELPELFRSVAARPSLRLIVKAHPAETPAGYAALAAGLPRIRIEEAGADLARLLAAADALVTRNSTVAIDALLLGLPTLVVGRPSNLSPFVEAGVMAGAAPDELPRAIERVLYDREARTTLVERIRQFIADGGMPADGRAAERAAEHILALESSATARAAAGAETLEMS